MNNWLNNFMIGKKKYSASVILPIIIALVNVMFSDSAAKSNIQALLQEFMPTLIALVGGISYTIIEGINDNTRIKTGTAEGAGTNTLPPASQVFVGYQPVEGQASKPSSTSGSAPVQLPNAPPWDMKAFDEKVKQKAPITYGVGNESTELYQALANGQGTECQFIDHAVSFWDYIQMKADARFSSVWGYSFREAAEKVTEPGCPNCKTTCGSFSNLRHKALSLGEQFYTAYLDYDRAREKSLDVQALAQAAAQGFDWKGLLPSIYQNLYFVGERAADLLKYVK